MKRRMAVLMKTRRRKWIPGEKKNKGEEGCVPSESKKKNEENEEEDKEKEEEM